LDGERELFQVLAGPVVLKSGVLEVAVKLRQLIVAESPLEADLEIQAGNALGSAEELVNWRPEFQLVIIGQRILRSEPTSTLELRRKIHCEATRHDAKFERLRRVQRSKIACSRIVQRLDCSQPGDARTSE